MPIGTPVSLGTAVPSGFTTTTSVSISAGIQANDLVVVLLGPFDSTTGSVSSVSDGTNTYTQAVGAKSAGNGFGFEIWFSANCSAVSSSTNVTATYSTSVNMKMAVVRVPGALTVSPKDATASNTTASATPSVSTGALAQASEIVFGAVGCNSQSGAYTEATGFTNVINSNTGNLFFGAGYKVVSSSSSVTYNPTLTALPSDLGIGVVSFKGTASSAVYGSTRLLLGV